MTVRDRKSKLIASNGWLTIIDDQTKILPAAARPVQAAISLFSTGFGQHEHPPLYDILLHFWLRWSGGSIDYLRVPSILLYAGLSALASIAFWRMGPRLQSDFYSTAHC